MFHLHSFVVRLCLAGRIQMVRGRGGDAACEQNQHRLLPVTVPFNAFCFFFFFGASNFSLLFDATRGEDEQMMVKYLAKKKPEGGIKEMTGLQGESVSRKCMNSMMRFNVFDGSLAWTTGWFSGGRINIGNNRHLTKLFIKPVRFQMSFRRPSFASPQMKPVRSNHSFPFQLAVPPFCALPICKTGTKLVDFTHLEQQIFHSFRNHWLRFADILYSTILHARHQPAPWLTALNWMV